jgi:hypothetical protein
VSLASQHFPELLSHEDVKTFRDSDGLLISDRRLADYDDRRPIVVGRTKLLLSRLDGKQLILKEFPLQDDMRGYMKEIVNVQRLQHRHIIRYSAVFEDEGSMFIEMEYCSGGSLRQWVQSTSPDATQKQSVLRQVLLALACMHDQKIVHCDIKGENIVIDEHGTARVCDFEMSKDLGASSASTMGGGTLGFIAPEVKDMKQKPSPSSDMYSFGVLALNLLNPPAATADYPLTDASALAGTPQDWVSRLMHEDPDERPTAVSLQTQPYFDVDKVVERRAQEAAVAAAQQVAEAEAQMEAAQAAQERARGETEEARRQANKQMVAAREARKSARLAEARAEEEKAAAALHKVALPQEWTSVSDYAGIEFVDAPEKCDFFARKMKQSAKVTADTRPEHRLNRLHVHRVVRVENAPLFESYQRERAKIRSRLDSTRAAGNDVERLEDHAPAWLAAKAGFPAVKDSDSNEFWLWHGTSASIDIAHPNGTVQRQETWGVLARHGFDERVGGDSNGGLYGNGIYLADAASKANQYATAPIATPPMNADGHHCMLSCRVTMGDPYMTPGKLKGQRRPPNNPATPGLPYDSVFATEDVTDNGNGPGSQYHNEYVVFAGAQVYPEYVIWYTK